MANYNVEVLDLADPIEAAAIAGEMGQSCCVVGRPEPFVDVNTQCNGASVEMKSGGRELSLVVVMVLLVNKADLIY